MSKANNKSEKVSPNLDTPTDLERNAIVIGSLAGALRKPTLLIPPGITRRTLTAELEMMQFRAWRRRGHRPAR